MIITIAGSMAFSEKMLEFKNKLEGAGHQVYISEFTETYAGKQVDEIAALAVKHKLNNNAMDEFFKKINKADALLVLNYERKGIINYVGANTLMDIAVAFYCGKKIFLINPIPDMDYCRSEIEGVKPIILNGDLSKIN